MEAQELRIGNYFLDRGGKLIQLHYWESAGKIAQNMVVGGMTVHPMTENVEYLIPIPLTEEWLLKLGFNKDYQKGYIGIDFGCTDFVLSTPENEDNTTGKYAWFFRQGRVSMFKPIDFVHQLQNLYHALTGEELEVKI